MPTPEQLSAEKRKRIAELCDPIHPNHGQWIVAGAEKYEFMGDFSDSPARAAEGEVIQKMTRVQMGAGDIWQPKIDPRQRELLTRKAAELVIKKVKPLNSHSTYAMVLLCALAKHIAENNTPQIEGLAYELIEGGKDD